MNLRSSNIYSVVLPIIISMLGTAILAAYFSPWSAVNSDSIIYLRMAQEIQKGHWHIDNWGRGSYSGPPFYPLLVAISEWFLKDFERAGIIISIAASSLLVIPIFLLARYFYSIRVAWFIIPIAILNPYYLSLASLPLTESLFTLILLSCLFLTYCALKSKIPLLWCAVGILSSAAWMTRDVGIIIPFISMCWVIMDRWFNKVSFTNIAKNAALLTLGIMIITVPFKLMMFLDLRNVSESPVISVSHALMMPDLRDTMEREEYMLGLNKDSTDYAFVEAQKNPPSVGEILINSDIILKKYIVNCIEVAKSIHVILGTLFILFVIVNIVALISYGIKEPNILIWQLLFPGVYVIFYILFYSFAGAFTGALGPERYLVPLIPVLGVWAVGGICKITILADKINLRHTGIVASFLCLGIILISYKNDLMHKKYILNASKDKIELYKMAGTSFRKSMRKPGANNITIMARSPFLPYHAGADWVAMPYGEYQEILKFARNRNVDYLGVDKYSVLLRPQLSFLMNRHANIPDMEKSYRIGSKKDPEEYLFVLYKINPL